MTNVAVTIDAGGRAGDLLGGESAATLSGSDRSMVSPSDAVPPGADRSAELLRAVAEAAPFPVLLCRRRDGIIVHSNAALGELLGRAPGELIGLGALDLLDDATARDAARRELASAGRLPEREVCLNVRAGERMWAVFSLEPQRLPGEQGQAAGAGALLLGALHDVTPWREAKARLEQSEARLLEELERANQSLREAQLQLVRSEKMASLGLLMAGIAHEIRTPLGAVQSTQRTISQALEKLGERLHEAFPEALEDSKLGRLLKVLTDSTRVVGDGSSRMTDIVQRLRKFSCAEEAKLCSVDVNAIADDTLALIHHELKHYVAIQRRYGEGVTLMGYPARLNQVLVNLLVNAAQAVRARGNGKITLETRAVGDHIEISVSDDGVGIPPENLGQIFACGFTTRHQEGGSGLGLAISKEIIDAHHGSLEVRSQVGAGSTFIVRLPRSLSDCRKPNRGCRF